MFGFTAIVGVVVLVAVVVFAHSPTPWLRALGLSVLALVTAVLLGATGYLLWSAFAGPRVTDGIGNWGLAFLAVPLGLAGWLAAVFLRQAWRYVPGASSQELTFERLRTVLGALTGRR